MKSKWITIQLGYVLGASALLTAIVYFFATNWEKLNRWEKFVPAFLLILGFYGLSIWLSRQSGRQFLSKLSLFASCISFGVGIGVIGQTYNSHADSYALFAVWFVPAFLFSLLTRWQPFYVLAYILGHLAYGYYFFPRWQGSLETEAVQLAVWLGLVLVNGALFVWTEQGRLQAPFLKWISFQAALGMLVYVSNSHAFEDYGVFMNLPLVIALAAAVRYTHKTTNKAYLLFTGLWISAAITVKYIELVAHYYNELFFIVSLLFIIVFIGANVKFMNYIRAWQPSGTQSAADEQAEGASGSGKADGDFTKWVVRVLTVSVVIVGSLLGSLTVIGIVTLVLGFEEPANILIGYGLAVVLGMIAAKKLNALVRYTILISGLLLGAGAAAFSENVPVLWAFLALTVAAFIYITGLLHRIFFVLAAIVLTAAILFNWIESGVTVVTILTVLLFALFAGGQVIPNASIRQPVLYSAYPTLLLSMFVLTFITESYWYYVANGFFFLLVLLALAVSKQLQIRWVFAWSMGFWTAFLVYKYYDLAWKLLHKSFTFAILGILILAFTVWYEKKHAEAAEPAAKTDYAANRFVIAVLVVLQIAAMSLQIGKSEWLLASGQQIRLQLEPLDPRSLIQGDYVRLRYTISEPPIFGDRPEEAASKRITVVLAPNAATGVYEFSRVYKKGGPLAAGEVRLNGKRTGFETVEYGIEHYFIPEGTGSDYERQAKFAEVKVSKNGDAILERLILQQTVVQ
ncbi:GDYXXLXY domain-containing protein [Paenibacillus sp. GCM10023248]|uniref:GDYXXLXY domain-containing protein n=1 Tax=unclassified Paenibacillus TaxID=185978 RepID=UPI002378E9B2|nr:GDYXXLXY domain-containing protein [Paenibacillus sp. MAHUQ-63]MDD9267450.1 GDYXXLXY domain-containing protein [Paenibacillus sp. MAHUQ-63]